jgi:PhnB protein
MDVPHRENAMKLYTYVNYAGKCELAFRFYEKHLGAKLLTMTRHSQSPNFGKVPPEFNDAVLHARISIGGTLLMGADVPGAQPMRSAYLSILPGSIDEAERIYRVLSEGEIFMPMEETPFATRFAMLRDKFGTSWMILHERPSAN